MPWLVQPILSLSGKATSGAKKKRREPKITEAKARRDHARSLDRLTLASGRGRLGFI